MADEIRKKTFLSVSNGDLSRTFQNRTETIDQATAQWSDRSVTVTTTSMALPLGSVVTAGIVDLWNTDATNYVQWGIEVAATFYPCGRLKPGENYTFRIDSTATIYLRANTASCEVWMSLLSD